MSFIQKANSLPTRWVGKTPKYGFVIRWIAQAGFTDEECKETFNKILQKYDKKEDQRRAEKATYKAYINSDEYPRSRISEYKQREMNELLSEITFLRNQNNDIFRGGYTGPAIAQHKAELDRIQAYEAKQKAEIEKKYDGSPECLENIRKIALKVDKKPSESLCSKKRERSGIGRGVAHISR